MESAIKHYPVTRYSGRTRRPHPKDGHPEDPQPLQSRARVFDAVMLVISRPVPVHEEARKWAS
jgi:hypothetical protein